MNRTNHHSPDRETIQKSGRSSHLATSLATRLAASLVACVLAASALATRLDAATIRILTPQSRTNIPQTHLPEGNHFTTFKSYLENVATLTTGDLEDYTPGSADGIIINLTASNGTYTETEQNKIRTLMTSTTPVLIFGGIGTDFPSNLAQTLAPLLGGGKINSKVSRTTQSVNRDAPAGLIESVDEIKFTNSAYKIEPATLAAGIGVSTEFTLTLWGPNRNILLLLDFMALSSLGTDGGIIQTNKQLAENIAIWLTRPTIIPLATIDTFAANPIPSPTATIGANPATGTTPLSSNLIWNTTDAGSVTITGTGLTSTSLTGNLTLTNTTGTHTYTLTARPVERATLTWTVTGATTLTLITPDGDQTVTGKTSHTVTAPGAYTLRATNLDGKHTTSSPLIVSWPASVTKNVTITVTAVQPTRPPALDDATLTVLPDPTNPGGIVLDGAIDPNPGTTGHATTFEEEKLFLLTATDLAGPWTVAAPSTWTAVISDEAHALQLIIAPLPPATPARFYRVATTLRPVDSSTGAPATGDTIRYDTTLIGHYRITIPAGQVKLIACQLDTTGTGVIKLTALIPAAPGGTIATRWNAGQEQSALMGRQSWSGPFDIRTGDTIRVTNPAATPLTLTVTGTVPHTATTTLTGGALNARSSVLPVAGAITGFGLTPGSSDYLTETAAGAYQAHLYGRSGWSGDAPAFRIGEGFLYHRNSTQAATWKQTITVTTDTPDITIVK